MTVSCVALFAQEAKGNKFIALKDYRREVAAQDVQRFVDEILSGRRDGSKGASEVAPVVHHEGVSYVWKRGDRGSNVVAVAATRWDANVLAMQEMLRALLDNLKMFCPSGNIVSAALSLSTNAPLKADSLREKPALVLSILEEMADFGYPQVTQAESLCELVLDTPSLEGKTVNSLDALLRRRKKDGGADDHGAGVPTLDVTGAVPWRKNGIVYKKNEVYLDAIEKVSALVGADGALISGRVQGSIQMKVYLSGMPECKIGLNDKFMMEAESGYQTSSASNMEGRPTSVAQKACRSQVALDYIKFHQAVKLQQYESDHQVHFVPPDGEFELLSYTVSDAKNFTLPFTVTSWYKSLGRTRGELNVKIKADFPSSLVAFQVVTWIPLPKSTVKVSMQATGGKTKSKYVDLAKNQTHWKLSELRGGKEHKFKAIIEMMATTELQGTSDSHAWEKNVPPLRLTFQVPMFTSTGLRIRFLKVHEKSGYQPVKWVRYLTCAGDDYEVRVSH